VFANRTVTVFATATDPAKGTLSYTWTPCCGAVVQPPGNTATVTFIAPAASSATPCPMPLTLDVTSQKSGLSTSKTVDLVVTALGDINQDGVVNGADLTLLAAQFGSTGCCSSPGNNTCSADVDNDCDVDGMDQALLIAAMNTVGCTCSAP